MLAYAFTTIRARTAGFVGAFLALFAAAALVTACGVLLETGLRGTVQTERYAAAPIIVAADQNVRQVEVKGDPADPDKVKEKAKPLFERVWLPADTVSAVASVPGVDAVVAELSFPAYVVDGDASVVPGPDGNPSLGHAWDSAPLTPFVLTDGAPPVRDDDVVLDAALAARTGLSVGDLVKVQATGAPEEYRLAGVAEPEAGKLSQQAALFFSAAEAERLSGRGGQVAVLGVFPDRGADANEVEHRLTEALAGTDARVHTGVDRGPVEFLDAASARVQLVSMGGAMAGTSVLVAVLVVVGTFALSIQQRYRELALLRAVAATPRQLRQLIGREALIVGLVAGATGAVAGLPLASVLWSAFVGLGAIPKRLELATSPFPLAAAVVITIAAAWTAARISARRTSRIRPAEALAEATLPARLIAPGRFTAGVVALAGGGVLLAVLSSLRTEPAAQPVTFLAVVVLATAVTLLGPVIARAAVVVVALPVRLFSAGGYLAAAGARANVGRVAAVVSPLALMIAMACTVAFVQTTMTQAAQRETEAGSLADQVLVAQGPGVPAALAAEVRDLDGVRAVTEVLRTTVRIGLGKQEVLGLSPDGVEHTTDLGVTAGALDDLGPSTVAVSEVTAAGLGVSVGDPLDVTMGDGTPVRLEVIAVYSRGLGFGDLVMDHAVVAAHVDNPLGRTALVALGDGANVEDLRDVAAGYPGIRLSERSAAEIEAASRQANAEVNYLALGLIVAFTAIAVVNTLAMATSARFREFALLRLAGSTRRQIRRMLRLEALMVAAIGIALGTGISVATLTAFSSGMLGTTSVVITPVTYAAIAGGATALVLVATMVPGRFATATRPEQAINARE